MKRLLDIMTAAGKAARSGALLLAVLAAPLVTQAQTVTLFGALSNFDVLNDTGRDAHGFEIQLDGITPAQAFYTFNATRYGGATVVGFSGGVIVRWAATYNSATGQYSATTVTPATFQPTFGHSCVLTQIVGCDHYGVSLQYYSTPPTATSYFWLVDDPTNPGQLVRFAGGKVQIPQPTVTVIPPAQIGNPPQVVFQIQVEPPPPPPIPKPVAQFGDAKWVKVYKTELQREVGLDELLDDNPIVPQDPSLLETAWKLLQFNPNTNGNSGILRNQGGLGSGSHSVLRRYEFYKYSGAYNPTDHSAVCADPLCAAPAPNELGDFIGSQNAAANVGVPTLTVTKVGSGTVTGANGKINCGGTCTTTTSAGTVLTLTATPPSNGVFVGWSGACNGTSLTCSVFVNDQSNVTANFVTIYTLSIGRSGSGTVTATPDGTDRSINCGSNCSAKFIQGTTVTLTATPAPGLTFVSWTNGCVSSTPTCNVVISKDTSAQANFK
jgi:hypothetical protein